MPKKVTIERTVSAAERALAILDAFTEGDDPLTLGDLEARTALFKSVILRYMVSFERHGYIKKRSDGRYQLGPRLFQLGKVYERTLDLSETLTPILGELSEKTGESASFYVVEGQKRVCLLRVESPHAVRVSVRVGSVLPLSDSATGQVIKRFRVGIDAKTESTKSHWLCSSSGVGDSLTASVSAPVFSVDNAFLGAMTIAGPIPRFDTNNEKVRKLLLSAATAASRRLGANMYTESAHLSDAR